MGKITMAGNEKALCGLWFDGQKYYEETLPEGCKEESVPVFDETKRWLDIYFSGKIPDFLPPLELHGSDFRIAVWNILLEIPYGQTMTYGQIADRIARQKGLSRMSAQAVGGAVGHNPISVIVPCHRVVGTNGSLTGYAGGIGKKIALLTLEHVNMEHFFIPKKGTAL